MAERNIVEYGSCEILKKRTLLDDFWEDVKMRDAIAQKGGNEDASGRIHLYLNNNTGRHHILFAGKPGLSKGIKEAFASNEVEFEEVDLGGYPGEEMFDKQKAKEIIKPRVFRTLKNIREELGISELPFLEQGAIQVEETIEQSVNNMFGKKNN